MSPVIRTVLATSLFLSSASCFADLAEESGFDFTLNANFGVGTGSSQSNTDKSNKITQDLNNNGKEQTDAIAFPLARLSYTLSSKKTQLFLGNSEADVVLADFKAELGVIHELANGTTVTLAYTPYLFASEAWQDPFLTKQERHTTDVDSQAARVRVDNLFSHPFTVEYTWGESSYENELSGQQQILTPEQKALLQRDTTYHQAYLEYTYAISEKFAIQPGLTVTRGNSEGDAMAFDKVNFQLAFVSQFSERSQLVSNVYIGQANYDESNPIFDKVQDDTSYGASVFYSYARPFNWENTSFIAMAIYNQNDSSIKFYDEDFVATSIGLAYEF